MKIVMIVLCLIFVLFVTTCLYSTIINIPSDQPTIQAGINVSSNGDTVLVQPGTYVENINYNGKNITIASLFLTTQDTFYISQTVIDGDSLDTVVKFESGEDSTAVLTGFTITQGSATFGGGICCSNNSNPSLENVTISGNSSNYYGGGISCHNSNPDLENVIISGNTAYDGGGIYINGGSPRLENVTITGNSANRGGGIYCYYNSNPSLVNVTISGNSAAIKGGGIYCDDSNMTFDIENRCNIYLNDSNGLGKDIYLHNTNVDVIVDTFTVIIPDNYFAYPMNNFTFDILHSAIEQVDQDLYVGPTGSDENSGLTADDPLKTINFAMYLILSNEENPHTIHLAEGIYSLSYTGENFPIYMKRFISIMGENPQTTVLNGANLNQIIISIFSNNNFSLQGITIRNGYTSWNGGGIYCDDSDITITDVVLVNNHACFRGGGIFCSGGNLNILNTSVTNNSASGRMDGCGGGICCTGSVNLNNVLINENYALIHGGGILCSGSDESQIFSNTVITGNTADYTGGGICFTDAEPELNSVTITQNHAQFGGGISFSNTEPIFDSENRCSIYSNTTSSNYSKDIYSGNSNNTVTVIVDTFTVSNPTDCYAAPIYNFTFDILHSIENTLINSDFYVSVTGDNSNTGTSANDPLKTIGCALSKIYADSLSQNTIHLSPGIYSSETNGEILPVVWNNFVSLEGSSEEQTILDGNNETGVMSFHYITTASIENITIRNGNDGGIICRYSNPSLTNVTIRDNYGSFGGGIYCRYSSCPSLTNVTIKGNSAGRGGGICCYYSSNPNLTNVTITDNNADYYGGGVFCSDSSCPSFTNVTIAGNNAEQNGGGIYCRHYSTLILTNCILWNDLPQEVYFYEYVFSSEITISYSDIQGGLNGIVINNNVIVNWLEGNIDTDPLFADTLYHLSSDSPCIDTGNTDPIYYDPEDPNNPGYALYPAMGTLLNDMGAYGGPNTIGWIPVPVNDDVIIQPKTCELCQNYPNPFNPITTINYSLKENSRVSLNIYNIKGQKIKTLTHNEFIKGDHSIIWNGDDNFGISVSSGIYYYKLNVNGKTKAIKKCLLLK